MTWAILTILVFLVALEAYITSRKKFFEFPKSGGPSNDPWVLKIEQNSLYLIAYIKVTRHFWSQPIVEIIGSAPTYYKSQEKPVGTCSGDSNYDYEEVMVRKMQTHLIYDVMMIFIFL